MARAVITGLEIHDAKLFAPTGIVYQWARKISKELRVAAQGFAPPNRSHARWNGISTGRLQRGISAKASAVAPKVIDITLNSSAKHTMHVHGGTAHQGFRYIYSNLGWANKAFVDELANEFAQGGGGLSADDLQSLAGLYMRLPPGPGGRFHLRVRGQRANPFLVDGYNLVAKSHRSLKGIRPKFKF